LAVPLVELDVVALDVLGQYRGMICRNMVFMIWFMVDW